MNTTIAATLAALMACVGAFFYGMHVEHQRFMGFVAKVEVMGEQAAKDAGRKAVAAEQLRKNKEAEHAKLKTATAVELADLRGKLRDARTRGSVVPANAPAPSGCDDSETGRTYWSRLRARVEGALVALEDRADGSIQRGADTIDAFNICAGWVQQLPR